jgi:hypothetical protein
VFKSSTKLDVLPFQIPELSSLFSTERSENKYYFLLHVVIILKNTAARLFTLPSEDVHEADGGCCSNIHYYIIICSRK